MADGASPLSDPQVHNEQRTREVVVFLCAGQECRACAEKADYLQRAYEVIHLPEVPQKSRESGKPMPEGVGPTPENIKKILENMKGMPGMEGMKVLLPCSFLLGCQSDSACVWTGWQSSSRDRVGRPHSSVVSLYAAI